MRLYPFFKTPVVCPRHTQAAELNEQALFEAAHKAYTRVLADMEATKGPRHPFTARAVNGLAAALVGLGQFGAALPLNERAVAVYAAVAQAVPQAASPAQPSGNQPLADLADAQNNLGVTLYKLGRGPEAQAHYESALAGYTAVFGAKHPMVSINKPLPAE